MRTTFFTRLWLRYSDIALLALLATLLPPITKEGRWCPWTMTTMMVVVMNVLHKEVMVSIGSTSAMLRSELVGFSLFFSFWCFMPKGEKLEGSILF